MENTIAYAYKTRRNTTTIKTTNKDFSVFLRISIYLICSKKVHMAIWLVRRDHIFRLLFAKTSLLNSSACQHDRRFVYCIVNMHQIYRAEEKTYRTHRINCSKLARSHQIKLNKLYFPFLRNATTTQTNYKQ